MKKYTWIWIAIIAIVLVIVAYSVGRGSNNNTSQSTNINSKSKCANDGQVFYLNFQKKIGRLRSDNWFDPQFHFNSKLNTCLVYIQWTGSPSLTVVTDKLIVFDVYSNQAILQSEISNTLFDVQRDVLDSSPLYWNIPNSNVNTFMSQLEVLMNE
jgi:hypothetical protein